MKLIVLDTGVVVAGVFWRHEPHTCLKAWLSGLICPVVSEGKLPVPGRNIPLGRGGFVPAALGGNSLPDSDNSPSVDRASALGFRYRVVVDADSSSDQQKMLSLVPDAFRTFTNGRSVIQAGAFRDREKAEELLQILTTNGLNARIEDIK